ncbi:MAG: transposase [Synergistaceae bacterium]|nr:transposase [Synergistaceae bacterium]
MRCSPSARTQRTVSSTADISTGKKLLYRVMSQLISEVDRLTGNNRESVLIADDSLFSRQRSKKVGLLSRVFGHTSHIYCRGFRMLTLGWSDGNTFLPVNFSLLSSPRDENVICPGQEADKRTNGYKRRKLARMSTTDVIIEMLHNAGSIPAIFVLFDVVCYRRCRKDAFPCSPYRRICRFMIYNSGPCSCSSFSFSALRVSRIIFNEAVLFSMFFSCSSPASRIILITSGLLPPSLGSSALCHCFSVCIQ